MGGWNAISDINKVYCDLNLNNSITKNIKPKLSKITIARAYCNLIRYYEDKIKCKSLLKNLLGHIKKVENVNINAKRYLQYSESIISKQIKQIKKSSNGKIFISFHFGAFELIPLMLSVYLQTTVYVVVDAITINHQIRLTYYNKLIKRNYPNADIQFILVQDSLSIRKLIKILRNNGIVFIYFDENKSVSNENINYVKIPFISGYNYIVRASVPYLLKFSDSVIYSVISLIENDKIKFKIQFITDRNEKNYITKFYANSLNLLQEGIKVYPHQWTRWYNVDELDDSSLNSNSNNSINNKLQIIDHNSQKKYLINIDKMMIKEICDHN